MKFTKFTPYGTRVLIKPDSKQEMTEGGLYIPDSAQRPSQTATVVAIGDKCEKVAVGKRIMIPESAGVTMSVNGEDFLLIMENIIDGEVD